MADIAATRRRPLAYWIRKPWVIALAIVLAYVIYGFASGSIGIYGWNLWLGVPWDWSHNIEVGVDGFYVNTQ